MNNKLKKRFSSERGISLLITFFIVGIALAIILGITVILFSEIKMMRGIGYSVTAFYMADSGLEKTLYYDRKQIPEGGTRGLCNMYNSCDDCHTGWGVSGTDCAITTCTDCRVSYRTEVDGLERYFNVVAVVSEEEGDIFQSYGTYKGIKRAIELSVGSGSVVPENPGPNIYGCNITPRSTAEGLSLDISCYIQDTDGVDDNTTIAHIQQPDETDLDDGLVLLESGGGSFYSGIWFGPDGVYYVDVNACDLNLEPSCSEKENI